MTIELVPRDPIEKVEPTAMPEEKESAWKDPKFYVPLIMLVLYVGSIVWSAATNNAATQISADQFGDVKKTLGSIDAKLTEQARVQAVANANTDKDIEYLKSDLAAFRLQYAREKDLQDTYINTTREKLIKIEAKVGKGD